VTGKLHLTLFHGSKGRRRPDPTAPAISAAAAAQALANFEFGPAPFRSNPAFAGSHVRTRVQPLGTFAPRPAPRPAAEAHR
jgi:hypothetical protein